jgi:HlyD family secretion protein
MWPVTGLGARHGCSWSGRRPRRLARSEPPEAEIGRLHGLKIIPGMPVEAFIQTESRTVLFYLLKPLRDQLMRTFREG